MKLSKLLIAESEIKWWLQTFLACETYFWGLIILAIILMTQVMSNNEILP